MKARVLGSLLFILLFAVVNEPRAKTYRLVYGHMNSHSSIAGKQANMFADLVAEKTGGEVKIQVIPESGMGNLQEMVEQVKNGTIAIHHNTMAGIGSMLNELGGLDTPFLYRDKDHLLEVVNTESSPVMKDLSQKLISKAGVRILYNFYFGTRQLTADRAIYSPKDLANLKIRAIPFPIYKTAVEGLGAKAMPVNWSDVPDALQAGIVNGQENPVDVIFNHKIFKYQSHIMLTNHIIAAECVVINERIWQNLPAGLRQQVAEAANVISRKATRMVLDKEKMNLENIKKAGMTVIGPEQGLDREAFRQNTLKIVKQRLAGQYGELYTKIKAIN